MQKNSEFDLNEQASIQEQESSENNSMEQQQQRENHLDNTDIIVNSNANNNGLIQDQLSLPEENQVAANKERKERIPWTEDEHRLFLQGLNKHGRGRWKDISKEFVPGRTSTQIASHAQKYFKHLKEVAGKERKKRRSIHDTTVDNNGALVRLPIEQVEIPSIEQQNEIPRLIVPSIEQQIEIPSIEGQNKVTHPVEQQNENISPHSTTLNDNTIDKLVTPPIETFQEMESQLKLGYTFTVEISPHNVKNVVKVCDLLEKALKS